MSEKRIRIPKHCSYCSEPYSLKIKEKSKDSDVTIDSLKNEIIKDLTKKNKIELTEDDKNSVNTMYNEICHIQNKLLNDFYIK